MGALAAPLMRSLDGTRVFVTGHTGFKGSWLVAVLRSLGAEVTGYALAPASSPNLFEEANLAGDVRHHVADVRDLEALCKAVREAAPDLVFHLAAQALVLEAYDDPVGTFSTNVQGTVNLLEAVRRAGGVKAVVVVTSDKCYEPQPGRPLRETDPLGGDEPYGVSKACAELAVAAFARSYFKGTPTHLATVRAGNVIGGGDWAKHRLVADLARAMMGDRRVILRHPRAVRPWQHVFDAISGYLLVAGRALDGDARVAQPWNFGPPANEHLEVGDLVERFARAYGGEMQVTVESSAVAENPALHLDSTRAREELGWRPVLRVDEAIDVTAAWYRLRADGVPVRTILLEQLQSLLQRRDAAFSTEDEP